MAKIAESAFGGFSGRLGNLVGYSWKGVWCVRTRPARVRNPRSEAQQRHRAMFAEEVRLAGRMSWAVNMGFAAVSDELHMTPQNVFVKANQQAFSNPASREEGNGDLMVDWNELIVSAGPVAPVALGTPEISAEGVLEVAFEKNPYHMRADAIDQVHLYVYCPAEGLGYMAAPVYRKDRKIKMLLPDVMVGRELHVYAFVTNEKGLASDTCYAPVVQGDTDDNTSLVSVALEQNGLGEESQLPRPPQYAEKEQSVGVEAVEVRPSSEGEALLGDWG